MSNKSRDASKIKNVACIVAEATETFGSHEKATRWLNKPNRALEGDTPLSRLETSIGLHQVEDILQRIEHGIFS